MFKKLVANLPFNPSLITQVSFYSARLKAERSIRRLSFLFIIAAMFVQMFAVVSPPERSLAASSNHILDGLSESKSAKANKSFLLQSWDNNPDIRAIYGYFGVTREDIATMPEKTVTVFSGNADYWTIGRNSLTAYSNVAQKYKNTQVAIRYAGEGTATTADDRFVYHRQLRAWDIVNKAGNSYGALQGTIKSTGETFWILYDCGNFTKIGRYTPPPPPPPPPPVNPINAVCSISSPIVIKKDQTTVDVPVRITLPSGKSIPRGSTSADGGSGAGLHLGVTTKGAPSTWNIHDNVRLAQPPLTPPDKQNDFVPTRNNLKGLTYYDFVWDYDKDTYERYFVTSAQTSSFDVQLNVRVNKLDKHLVIRLLDRDLGQWLPHNSSCEVPISREVPAPTPQIKTVKTILNKKSSYKPGDEYTYLIQYRNTVNASIAENVEITDELDTKHFDVVRVSPNTAKISNGFLRYERGSLPFSNSYEEIKITVKLKDQISTGAKVCNASRMTASNASASASAPVCIFVITPCPYDPTLPDSNNPNCKPIVVCDVVTAVINRTTRKVTFKTTVESSNPAKTKVINYAYDYGDGSPIKTNSSTNLSDESTHTYEPGDYTAKVTISYTAEDVAGTQTTEACSAPISFEEDQPVGRSKSVRNITQDKTGDAAISTTVKANDVLEYTLTTTNSQSFERTGIEIADYIGDILDYATLDLAQLEGQGGRYDESSKMIIWKDVTIPANGEVLRSFQVKIKDPIPSTNTPSSMTTNFDCKISNEYGNEITMNINCPLVKGIETLPNTGPGSSIVMTVAITTIVGYFFFRSRLLAREIEFVRTDYAMTGGM